MRWPPHASGRPVAAARLRYPERGPQPFEEEGDCETKAVVFDVGRVLFQWQLRALFEKLIEDREELDWFLAHVVTEEWHFEHDRGATLAEMLP